MATVVTKSIGTTGRDYSTLQAWEDAIPTNLVTADEAWVGECYNDSEFTAGVVISGHTVNSTHTIKLTVADGHSFMDHATVRDNPLIYDQSKGAGVSASPFNQAVIAFNQNYVTVERLQIKRPSNSYGASVVGTNDFWPQSMVRDCIIQKAHSGNASIATIRKSSIINCPVLDTGGNGNGIALSNGGLALNCTVARSSSLSATGTGITSGYSGNTLKNCAIFGFATDCSASGISASSDYNATDVSGGNLPGANSLTGLVYADQFVSTTGDWRLKAGSSLIDSGNVDGTNAPNDITGIVRDAGLNGDIGAWEYRITTVKSIGTNARDYSTLQAWEDACPSNLVSNHEIWKGECYNDSEFTGGLIISGQTTDTNCYPWLTVANGHSFIDHINAATNPLQYDQTKGVGVSANPTELPLIDVYAQYTRIERLQIKRSGWQFGHPPVRLRSANYINQCVIENSVSSPSGGYTLYLDEGSKAENCCVIARANNQHGIGLFFSSIADSCTVVCDSAVGESGGTGINDVHGNATAKNCAVFGFATSASGSFNASSDYNATNKSSGLPGSNSLHNLVFADQFVNTSNDFRLKTGAGLINAGNTTLTTDIIGQARNDPDIGSWEYTAAGGGDGNANPTGTSGTSAIGNETASGSANINGTGVSGTGSIGNETASVNQNVNVTGISGTGSIGNESTSGSANLNITGISATGSIGSETTSGSAVVSETGVSGTGQVGTAVASSQGSGQVNATGVSGTGEIGNETVSGGAIVDETGVSGTGESGVVNASSENVTTANATGVSGSGYVGIVIVSADSKVSITGISGIGYVGNIFSTNARGGISKKHKRKQYVIDGKIYLWTDAEYTEYQRRQANQKKPKPLESANEPDVEISPINKIEPIRIKTEPAPSSVKSFPKFEVNYDEVLQAINEHERQKAVKAWEDYLRYEDELLLQFL